MAIYKFRIIIIIVINDYFQDVSPFNCALIVVDKFDTGRRKL